LTPTPAASQPPWSFDVDFVADLRCPNCGGHGLKRFYAVRGIPVHTCLLMPSREAALGYPRGDLALGFCGACGFAANTLFDASVHEYSETYEETQGFSPTFNAFAKSLAQRLVDDWDLRGKTALEIGCGKGEFLVTLCELGAAKGIGIDPAYVPARTDSAAAPRLEFIRDFYSEAYAHLSADFVCCRHTLEHIAPTQEFLELVRSTLNDRGDAVVFFEVPDVARVLREGAFWDIYYEHCSYFSLGSLARLFRNARFDVCELWLDYDDQYVMLVARPVDAPTPPALPIEDDQDDLARLVEAFPAACASVIDRWHAFFRDTAAAGKRAVVWGSGSKGAAFLATLGLTEEVRYVVDINPYKQGKFMPGTGQEIVAPEFLREYQPDVAVIMNPVYKDEIAGTLAGLGVDAACVAV